MPDNTIDGTPDAVKVACPVWSGGKSNDYFKGLPITIIDLPAAQLPAPQEVAKNCGMVLLGGENADSFLYLGGNEKETHKYISELLGKETIDTQTSSQSKGRNGSYSRNFQQTGRELLTPDEVRRLDNRYAIALIRGEEPVMDEKYDLMRHPNLKYTEDGGAAPYIHSSTCLYGLSDDSVLAFADLNEIKILDESEEIYE